MKSIQKLIFSMTPNEKGGFKKSFSSSGKKKDYLKLFDILNSPTVLEEKKIREQFSSHSKYSQAKSQLKDAIYRFQANKELTTNHKSTYLLHSIEKYAKIGAYECAIIALDDLYSQIIKEDRFDLAEKWMQIFKVLPLNLMPPKLWEISLSIKERIKESQNLDNLQDSILNLIKSNSFASEKREQYQSIYLSAKQIASKQGVSPKTICRALLIQRKTLTLLQEFEMAVQISEEYLSELRNANVSQLEYEKQVIAETNAITKIFLVQKDFSKFLSYCNQLTSFNFSFPGLRLMALHSVSLNQLIWGSDFGVIEIFKPVLKRIEFLEREKFYHSHPKYAIRAFFNLAKYAFIIGDSNIANRYLFRLEGKGKLDPIYHQYLPHLLQMQLEIALKENEVIMFDSFEKKFRRFLRENSEVSPFFSPFLKYLSLAKKGQITQFSLYSLELEIQKMKNEKQFDFLFSLSPYPDLISSQNKGFSLQEFRREKLGIVPQEVHSVKADIA